MSSRSRHHRPRARRRRATVSNSSSSPSPSPSAPESVPSPGSRWRPYAQRLRGWLASRNWNRLLLRWAIALVVTVVMSGLATSAGLDSSVAVFLSAVWVAGVWFTRSLVTRLSPHLGRPTAWAAVVLGFALVGGAIALFPSSCGDSGCSPRDVSLLVLLSTGFPLLVLLYTGPVMATWALLRRGMRAARVWWEARHAPSDPRRDPHSS